MPIKPKCTLGVGFLVGVLGLFLIMPAFGGLAVVGRYLYPSLIPVVGLVWLGALNLFSEDSHKFIIVIAVGGLAVLDLFNLVSYVQSTHGW